jgi:hypothetical protein
MASGSVGFIMEGQEHEHFRTGRRVVSASMGQAGFDFADVAGSVLGG